LADEKKVPAFVIFNDRALIAMCRDRPLNTAQFLAIDGVGPKKCEDFGEKFMSVIKEFGEDLS
ncbi:HRDC domain-containing protein, partial [Luminiphilus sp.]|nr:HRDC domain-containing protein [Luminiphilus sp.]